MASELVAADTVAVPPPGGTTLQALRDLGSGPRGLTDAEAENRLAATGENTVPELRTASWPLLCVRALRDPFTAVLLCLGLVSTLVSSWGTAAVVLGLVAVSCVLRASGEHRDDRSMAALRELVAGTATVLRRPPGEDRPRAREVPVAELVPGDVIRLGPGDLVPADVRLLRARGLGRSMRILKSEAKAMKDESGTAAAPGGRTVEPSAVRRPPSVVRTSAEAAHVAAEPPAPAG
ncbi:cation-transporting P-type ATPase [Streptomyces anandii]|uniref:cation-transporting P-type ATPase n=1 Tax=Streptomyces anandii TaxID=285454 RepID=UPI0036FFA68D